MSGVITVFGTEFEVLHLAGCHGANLVWVNAGIFFPAPGYPFYLLKGFVLNMSPLRTWNHDKNLIAPQRYALSGYVL